MLNKATKDVDTQTNEKFVNISELDKLEEVIKQQEQSSKFNH